MNDAMLTRRRRRRLRAKRKAQLDAIALSKICENMLWSMDTWGGTRCPGCGIKVRPHWLINFSGPFTTGGNSWGWMTAFGYACHKTKCPGENPNWMLEVKEHEA